MPPPPHIDFPTEKNECVLDFSSNNGHPPIDESLTFAIRLRLYNFISVPAIQLWLVGRSMQKEGRGLEVDIYATPPVTALVSLLVRICLLFYSTLENISLTLICHLAKHLRTLNS